MKLLAVVTGTALITAIAITWHAAQIASIALANRFELGKG